MAKKHVKKSEIEMSGTVTQFTRTGERNLTNRKPYRTDSQQKMARKNAVKKNGTWVSDAPVSFHPEFKG